MPIETRRFAVSLCALCAILAGAPAPARGWSAGTHVYAARHTDKKAGQVDANELCNRAFGANAVDLFNRDFTPAGQLLAGVLHDRGLLVPLLPYGGARTDAEVAFAYGFATHNDTWGTDSVAHYAGITFGRDQGYVIAKAATLAPELRALIGDELPFRDDQLLLVAHILVEYGVDFLLASVDPSVGPALVASTACPAPAGIDFLADALAPAFEPFVGAEAARSMVLGAAPRFLAELRGTGFALMLPPDQGIPLVAAANAAQAEGLLGLPPGALDPVRPMLAAIAEYGIWRGMQLCAPDFLDEIGAMIGRVNGQTSARGISP